MTCHLIPHSDLGVSGSSLGIIIITRCIQCTITLLWYQGWDVWDL